MAKFGVRRLSRILTTERLIITLSLTALYGRQLVDTITVGPLADIADALSPVLGGIGWFYWAGVAMMYFIHLFAIRAVYEGFDISLLDRYPSFYHVFAAIATIVAQYMFVSIYPGERAPAYLEPVLTMYPVATILPFFGLIAFAKLQTSSSLTKPDSPYLEVLNRIGISRAERVELDEETDIRRFGPYLLVVVVTGLYYTSVALMGGFTAGLRIYPGVLEVVGIVAVVGSKALRTSRMGKQRVDLADLLDQVATFDSPFYDVIKDTPLGAGWGFLLALLFGTILVPVPILLLPAIGPAPLGLFSTGLSGLVGATTMSTTQALELLTRSIFWLVITSTPYLVTVFGLWFWYQSARRTPSIIQQRASESGARKYEGEIDMPPVARPRGWLLPMIGLLLITFSHPVYVGMPGLGIPALHAPSVQISAWLTAIGLFGWCIVATATAEPRRSHFPTIELFTPAFLTAGTLVYAQRQWELLTGIGVLAGIIVFMINSEQIFNWMFITSLQGRVLRVLPAMGLFAAGGWQVAGLTGAFALGSVTCVLFLFLGEWYVREERKVDDQDDSDKSQNTLSN